MIELNSLKDLKALLKSRGIKYRDANRGQIRVECSTCGPGDGKKMKRYINPCFAYSRCWICEQELFLSDILGQDIKYTGVVEEDIHEHPQAREFPFTSAIPVNKLPLDHPAIKFLEKDHFSNFDELYEKYWVYYVPEGSERAIKFDSGAIIKPFDSLVFPVWFNNEFVGYQCRFVPGTPNGDRFIKMKYMHIFNKGKYLYNFDQAKQSDYCVVFEGAKKTWKFSSAGVSTLGKGISNQQIQLLQNNWKKIIFFLDSNAQSEADVAATIIRIAGRETVNINPKDYGFESPDEMTHEQVKEIIKSKL